MSTLKSTLRQVMLQNPGESEKGHFDKFLAIVNEDVTLRNELAEYWFGNQYKALTIERLSAHSVTVREVRTERFRSSTRQRNAAEVSRLAAKMKAALLDFKLSSGVALRDATFGQCALDGGWLQEVARQGKAHEIVGRKLTEADLQNLMRRAATKRAA